MSTQLPPDTVAPEEERFAAAPPAPVDPTVPVVPDPDVEPINYNPVDPDDGLKKFLRFLFLLLGPLLRLFGVSITSKRSHRLTIYRSTAAVSFDDSSAPATLFIPFTELVAFDSTVGDLGSKRTTTCVASSRRGSGR